MSRDPRIDDYIARQAEFARPILEHLRAAVHVACPDAEETMKWSRPHFLYRHDLLAGMAAFKAHVAFGFWRGKELLGEGGDGPGMGQFGRIASIADLPAPDVLDGWVRKAMALTDGGAKKLRPAREAKGELAAPDDLAAALGENDAARATFDAFPPSCRREYIEWVVDAKRPETRAKRIAQAAEWMAEGKRRNWKYEAC